MIYCFTNQGIMNASGLYLVAFMLGIIVASAVGMFANYLRIRKMKGGRK